MPTLKNRGPLLVDKVRGYFDRLPPWLRDVITVRTEKQKVDSKVTELDPNALESKLTQEITDEKLRSNSFLGDGEVGSGNDMTGLPASHPSEIVIRETGQVANVTETVSATEEHLVEGPPLQDGTSEQVGNVWVKKEVTASTFDDKIFQLQREDLIPKEFRALVPEKLEAHTVDGDAALPTLGSGELLKKEEQKKVGVKTVSVQSRDMTTPAVLVGQKIDPQWNGATLNLEQKIVPANTVVTQTFGVTSASIKPIDGTNAVQETWKIDSEFPIVHSRRFDADLQIEVIDRQSIVPIWPSAYTPSTGVVSYEEKVIDAVHALRREEVAGVTPPPFNTYTTTSYTFPGILTYISFSLVQLAAAGRKEPQWVIGVRPPFTTPTSIRNYTEFFLGSAPAPLTLQKWATTDITYKGISFSINISNVLVDTWSNIGVTYAADTYYGNAADRFSISQTAPTATGYINAMGLEGAIASVVDRYKRFWIRKTSYIVLT